MIVFVLWTRTEELPVSCRVLPNNTVICNEDVYDDFGSWRKQKEKLDKMIQEFRHRLDRLKVCSVLQCGNVRGWKSFTEGWCVHIDKLVQA